MTATPDALPHGKHSVWDSRFLTFLSGVAMTDIGDQAWVVVLAYAAAASGDPLIATATVAAGTIPRAILDLVGGAIADRLPTRPLIVGAAAARVVVLALGLVALLNLPDRTIPIMIVVAVFFGATDALHKPAVFTMPRQLVSVPQLVRAAGLRQLIARGALLGGPAIAGVVLAAAAVPGALAVLLGVFAVAAVLLSMVRVRYPREPGVQQSVIASTREVIGYLRRDSIARALVFSLIGLNFFVTPVVSAGVAIRVYEEGWGARALGLLMASIGAGAVLGTAVTLRIKPAYPMRFALVLLVTQGFALTMVGVLPAIGVGVALGMVGLTAGLSSPMLAAAGQALVEERYTGRFFSLVGLADDALMPFALIGYGLVAAAIGIGPTTVICGIGMAVLMAIALLRRPLRRARIHQTQKEPLPEQTADGSGDGSAVAGQHEPARPDGGHGQAINGAAVAPQPETPPLSRRAMTTEPPDSEPRPRRAAPHRSAPGR